MTLFKLLKNKAFHLLKNNNNKKRIIFGIFLFGGGVGGCHEKEYFDNKQIIRVFDNNNFLRKKVIWRCFSCFDQAKQLSERLVNNCLTLKSCF